MASAAGRPNRSGRAQSARCARLPIGSGESDFNCRRQAWASATGSSGKRPTVQAIYRKAWKTLSLALFW